tara:strand:+ start:3784 stop:4203 length:420 start_codon:yes stop_codon:yes gene_type:complete
MKKNYTLDCAYEHGFVVLAINSHSKAYKLCWNLNQSLGLNFEMTNDHKIREIGGFTRYKSEDKEGGEFNILSNRSKNGYMISSQKSVNYFLIINKDNWEAEKEMLLIKLRAIKDILLVFELSLETEKNTDRLIIYDKKN